MKSKISPMIQITHRQQQPRQKRKVRRGWDLNP